MVLQAEEKLVEMQVSSGPKKKRLEMLRTEIIHAGPCTVVKYRLRCSAVSPTPATPMQNGCICCTLREDLIEEVERLARMGRFDYLIIESTGISEPMQVPTTCTCVVLY